MLFEVFFPMWSHVNKNEKKKKKRKKSKYKILKKQKTKTNKQQNGLEIWGKGTFPPNFSVICLTGSEKTGFTDDGRTTDTRLMTVALLCSSTK